MIYAIQSVFEELCQGILFDNLNDVKIRFTVEYDGNKNESCITSECGGECFNPLDSDRVIIKC